MSLRGDPRFSSPRPGRRRSPGGPSWRRSPPSSGRHPPRRRSRATSPPGPRRRGSVGPAGRLGRAGRPRPRRPAPGRARRRPVLALAPVRVDPHRPGPGRAPRRIAVGPGKPRLRPLPGDPADRSSGPSPPARTRGSSATAASTSARSRTPSPTGAASAARPPSPSSSRRTSSSRRSGRWRARCARRSGPSRSRPASRRARLIEIYLNIAEWGPGVYGVGEAARFWFGKDARELTAAGVRLPGHGDPEPAPLPRAAAPLRDHALVERPHRRRPRQDARPEPAHRRATGGGAARSRSTRSARRAPGGTRRGGDGEPGPAREEPRSRRMPAGPTCRGR